MLRQHQRSNDAARPEETIAGHTRQDHQERGLEEPPDTAGKKAELGRQTLGLHLHTTLLLLRQKQGLCYFLRVSRKGGAVALDAPRGPPHSSCSTWRVSRLGVLGAPNESQPNKATERKQTSTKKVKGQVQTGPPLGVSREAPFRGPCRRQGAEEQKGSNNRKHMGLEARKGGSKEKREWCGLVGLFLLIHGKGQVISDDRRVDWGGP